MLYIYIYVICFYIHIHIYVYVHITITTEWQSFFCFLHRKKEKKALLFSRTKSITKRNFPKCLLSEPLD